MSGAACSHAHPDTLNDLKDGWERKRDSSEGSQRVDPAGDPASPSPGPLTPGPPLTLTRCLLTRSEGNKRSMNFFKKAALLVCSWIPRGFIDNSC